MKKIIEFYWLTLTLQFDGSNMPKTIGGNFLLFIPFILSEIFLDFSLGNFILFFPKIAVALLIFSLLHPIAKMAALSSHTVILLIKFILLLIGFISISQAYSLIFIFGEMILFLFLFVHIARNSTLH